MLIIMHWNIFTRLMRVFKFWCYAVTAEAFDTFSHHLPGISYEDMARAAAEALEGMGPCSWWQTITKCFQWSDVIHCVCTSLTYRVFMH